MTSRTRGILVLMLAGLMLMVGYSVLYQLDNPGMTRDISQQARGQGQAADRQMMDMVSGLMQNLQEDPGDIETLERLGLIFMRMESWERASGFWERILEQDSEHIQARQQLANCYFRMEEYAQAALELQKVLEIDPQEPHAHFNLGLLYAYYLQDSEQAREHLQAVLEYAPENLELQKEASQELQNLTEQ